MNEPTVFIVNAGGGHNFEPAKAFGKLVYLSAGPVSKYATSRMYRRFVAALETSSSEDMLLQTSLTTMNIVAAGILIHKHGRINLLLYKDENYVKRTVQFSQI